MKQLKTTTDIQNDLLEFAIKEKLGVTDIDSFVDIVNRTEEINVKFKREV